MTPDHLSPEERAHDTLISEVMECELRRWVARKRRAAYVPPPPARVSSRGQHFSLMPPENRVAMARAGGLAVFAKRTGHLWNSLTASRAAQKSALSRRKRLGEPATGGPSVRS